MSVDGNTQIATSAGGLRRPDLRHLFDLARSLPTGERDAFLSRQCGSDTELLAELNRQLAAASVEDAGKLDNADSVCTNVVCSPADSAASSPDGLTDVPTRVWAFNPASDRKSEHHPERVGPYLLTHELGRGGMGSVYLASRVDGEFQQQVAIKLIRVGWENEFSIRRFRNERQILATLDHPFIARLLDGGTTGRGSPYFVMEYVEGRPVVAFCDEQKLSSRERIELFLRIAEAVAYAHQRNVVHRDLKPGNILVRPDQTPKLLDFGIAKLIGTSGLVGSDTIQTGYRLLTPAYASPEQTRGDEATAKSDIYSLGVILHELLWGERPTLSSLSLAAQSPPTFESDVSLTLETIVFRAMRWDPEERYATVAEFATHLRNYLDGGSPLEPYRASTSVAVLPFRYRSPELPEQAYLPTGIADALTAKLSTIERLSVRPTAATMRYSGPEDWSRAARELRVQYLLDGAVQVRGGSIRVRLQLIAPETNSIIWSRHFDEPASALAQLEERVAEQVAEALLPYVTGQERAQLSSPPAVNPQAHQAYLQGRAHWSRSGGRLPDLEKAYGCFRAAVQFDPTYARAHAGIADYYVRLGLWGSLPPRQSFQNALTSAREAVRLDPSMGEGHASLAFACWALGWNPRAAEEHFQLAITHTPNHSAAHHWFGLLHASRQQYDLALANLERARHIDPRSAVILAALCYVHFAAGQASKALQLAAKAEPDMRRSPVFLESLTWCHLQVGNLDAALAAATEAVSLSRRSPSSLAALAFVYQSAGKSAEAVELANELDQLQSDRFVSGYDRATAWLAARQPRRALACLHEAVTNGDWWAVWLPIDPRWAPLRSHPQYRKLLQSSSTDRQLSARPAVWRRLDSWAQALLAAVLLVLLSTFAYRSLRSELPFPDPRFTRLTGNGVAHAAAISPDGRQVAYTATAHGETTILLRNLATGNTRELATHLAGFVSNLHFGQAADFLAYVRQTPGQSGMRSLYQVSLQGQTTPAEPLLPPFFAGGALSPDGRVVAYYERIGARDELWIYDRVTAERRLLKSLHYPERLDSAAPPAWSVDGTQLAYAAESGTGLSDQGFFVRLFVLNLKSGVSRPVPSPRWNWVEQVTWCGRTNALAVVAQERDSPFRQIWYTPLTGGSVRRIGNNLENYGTVSLSADGQRMVAVRLQTDANLYTAPWGDLDHPHQITLGSGRYFDVAWTPDNRTLYASDGTGVADLFLLDQRTGEGRALTGSLGRNYAPAVSPDGKLLAFHSNRSGGWQIWVMSLDGGPARQLSHGSRDANWPQFSADGRWIVYHQTDWNGSYNLWRVPAAGGEPQQITTDLTMHPSVDPNTDSIAAWWGGQGSHPAWRIAVFNREGGPPRQVFQPTPHAEADTTLRWTRSGQGITYLDRTGGTANLWLQPINGSPPHCLTHFTSGEIYSFDWNSHSELTYSHGLTTWNVVMIDDARVPSTLGR